MPDQIVPLRDQLFTQLQPLDAQGQPNQQVISDSAVKALPTDSCWLM